MLSIKLKKKMRSLLYNALKACYKGIAKITDQLKKLIIKLLKPEDNSIKELVTNVNERPYEYAFVAENIKNIENVKKILDVGCADSTLSIVFAALGYDVTGMDIREWKATYKNFVAVVDDIKTTKFSGEGFDVIISISTIEHIGLAGRYGESDEPNGGVKAVEQIYRILRRGGYFIITVPYGRDFISHSPYLYRVYGSGRFNNLSKNFFIEKQIYYKPIYNQKSYFYVECSKEDAIKIDPSKSRYAFTCALMKKV